MARPLITPAKFYRTLHNIADRKIGAVERAFLAAIHVTQREVDSARLARALERRDLRGVLDAINLNGQLAPRVRNEYARILREVFTRAGVAAATQFPATVNLRFDLTNPRAVRWARERAAQLVTNVSNDTRAAIRLVVSRGFRQGRTVDEMAKQIRGMVGITERQALTLENRRTGLLLRLRVQSGATVEDAAADLGYTARQARTLVQRSYQVVGRTTELSEPLIAERIEKHAAKQLRYRARMVARTETIASASGGQRHLWRTAEEQGLIRFDDTAPMMYRTPVGLLEGPGDGPGHPPIQCRCAEGIQVVGGVARRFWIVAEDERLCPICAAIPGMNPDGVGLADEEQVVRVAA